MAPLLTTLVVIPVFCCLTLGNDIDISLTDTSEQTKNESKVSEPKQSEEKSKALKGQTIDNPIIFEGINDLDKLDEMQRGYIQKHYPDYKIISEAIMIGKNEQRIVSFDLENKEEKDTIELFFDINDAFIEYVKKNKKEIEKAAKEINFQFVFPD